jgi:hypothetical protein
MQRETGGARNEDFQGAFHGQGSCDVVDANNRKVRQHSTGLLPRPHGKIGRVPASAEDIESGEDVRSGISELAGIIASLGPLLTIEEAASFLTVSPREVTEILPVFGDDDDKSILRDDVLKYLERSEI